MIQRKAPRAARAPRSAIVKSNDKKRARLNCMRHFLSSLDYPGKDSAVVTPPDPLLVGQAGHVVHSAARILGAP